MNLFHAILTRFNLKIYDQSRFDPSEWMEKRWGLFRRFTAPSIANQQNKNFRWFVFFDDRTPGPDQVRAIGEELGFTPLFCPPPREHSFDTAVLAFKSYLHDNIARADVLITTRLDNDDALHRLFIKDIQQRVIKQYTGRTCAINLQHGLRLDLETSMAVSVFKLSNPFISLVEPFIRIDDIKTVWARQHTHIREIAPILEVKGWHKWLQVAHADNVKNKPLKGNQIPLSAIADDFGLEAA